MANSSTNRDSSIVDEHVQHELAAVVRNIEQGMGNIEHRFDGLDRTIQNIQQMIAAMAIGGNQQPQQQQEAIGPRWCWITTYRRPTCQPTI